MQEPQSQGVSEGFASDRSNLCTCEVLLILSDDIRRVRTSQSECTLIIWTVCVERVV